MRVSANTSDILAAVALGALGAYIVRTAIGWDWMTSSGPGPGFFPVLYGGAMIGLALVLLLRASMQVRSSEDEDIWRRSGRSFGLWLVFIAGVALLPIVGYSVVMAVLTLFIATVLYRRSFGRALIAAILVPAGFHLIFVTLLGVELPLGYTGF